MKTLSNKFIARLTQVTAAILAEPALYSQISTCPLTQPRGDACGTPACILGWAVFLFRSDVKVKLRLTRKDGSRPHYKYALLHKAGTEALGLKATEANLALTKKLFEPYDWPSDDRIRYQTAVHGSQAAALAATQRIMRFIRTNGAE